MFSGEERAAITTEAPEEAFYEKVQEALESFGEVDVDDSGNISISPKTSMVSFLSTLTMSGKVKQTDDGYKVEIQYSLAPSVSCWLLAVVLLCVFFPGVAIVVAPLILDKPNISKAAENALRDVKDAYSSKKKK